jgi:hypothetical protein
LYILLNVNHKDKSFIWNNQKITINRGSGIFSQKKISEKLGISLGTVNRVLNYFEKDAQIGKQTTNKYTVITVINWNKYQANGKQIENRLKTDEKQIETYKNDNNVKNDNDIPKGMDTPTYGNKDLISLKKFLINNYPKPLVGITDTRKLQNIRQVSTRRKNQDEWMEDNWKENIKNFLSLYIERTPEEYLVNSIDKLRERIKLWREYRGKLN